MITSLSITNLYIKIKRIIYQKSIFLNKFFFVVHNKNIKLLFINFIFD